MIERRFHRFMATFVPLLLAGGGIFSILHGLFEERAIVVIYGVMLMFSCFLFIAVRERG